MPLIVPYNLPAIADLERENIFINSPKKEADLCSQILKIGVLNLMPLKQETETDLLRLLSNSNLKLELTFIYFKSHLSKNTSAAHMEEFYTDFNELKECVFDGLIITGAPLEHLPFEEVTYWEQLKKVMDWSLHNVRSTIHICWAAQAALYHRYDIEKIALPEKMFGVFKHRKNCNKHPLLRGFDDEFYVPHSRHTTIDKMAVESCEALDLLSESDEAGVYIAVANKGKEIYITGHSEYPLMRLDGEYRRDLAKSLPIEPPLNYYKDNEPNNKPLMRWQSHANLLFNNWLNYYVNSNSPYK